MATLVFAEVELMINFGYCYRSVLLNKYADAIPAVRIYRINKPMFANSYPSIPL